MNEAREQVVVLRNVNYQVEDTPILEDATCHVYRGEIFGVMGMSGVGKSTLLRLIMGLIKPDAGQIVVLGRNIEKLGEHDLNVVRQKLGLCFQGAALFDSMTVAENVAFGLRRQRPRRPEKEIQRLVAEHLDIVGMEESADRMPSHLSGGMRKRVGIARALIMQPEIMLYDEPTAGLDPIMSGVILHLIAKLREQFNMTSIIVTHEVERLFTVADRAIMLHQGRIIAEDVPENLRCCDGPEVRQFVLGLPDGPIKV
jgi:phospholipid/cholesterol/gamma-HCH transport system ATP-binding protein